MVGSMVSRPDVDPKRSLKSLSSDGAFTARSAVLEARERAGSAYCTLLAMTGVELMAWPREGALGSADPASD